MPPRGTIAVLPAVNQPLLDAFAVISVSRA